MAGIAWAKLLARVGEEFPLECPNCGGDIRLIAFITAVGIQGLVSKWDSSGVNTRGYCLMLHPLGGSNENLIFQMSSSGSDYAYVHTTGVNLADGLWHHLVGTHTPGGNTAASLLIYVDGVAQTVTAGNGGSVGSILNNQPVELGYRYNPSPLYLNGALDEVAIYPRQLSGTAVREHYLAGTTIPIPEPSSVFLLVCGGGLLVARSRRRR